MAEVDKTFLMGTNFSEINFCDEVMQLFDTEDCGIDGNYYLVDILAD